MLKRLLTVSKMMKNSTHRLPLVGQKIVTYRNRFCLKRDSLIEKGKNGETNDHPKHSGRRWYWDT